MLEGKKAVVVGGSRGLGLGIVEALVARKAQVTVVARDEKHLAEVKQRLGVQVVRGDATDPAVAREVLSQVKPAVLAMMAGVSSRMAPLHEHTWESFSAVWNNDVKATFHWVQEALRLPLEPGSRVLLGSSGAALNGSPLSGGYAGAKKMIAFMASYASGVSGRLELGIRFQALVPMQIIPDTDLGRAAAEGYAKWDGKPLEEYLKRFGKPLPPRELGELVATILTDPRHEKGIAFGLKGEVGITPLDG